MMQRSLIVNADDANLTPGVTKAILDCSDHGIIKSMTWFVNMPSESEQVREVLKRKDLGVGVHLNLTRGFPVSQSEKVRSLTDPSGRFRDRNLQLEELPRPGEIVLEYQNQIQLFQKIFGRCPTHLDTHHQLHDHPIFFRLLTYLGAKYRLPIRRSALMRGLGRGQIPCKTSDYLFGNLSAARVWNEVSLGAVLSHLPVGTSEIVCHPGKNDRALKMASTLGEGREQEYRLFRSPKFRKLLEQNSVVLKHY